MSLLKRYYNDNITWFKSRVKKKSSTKNIRKLHQYEEKRSPPAGLNAITFRTEARNVTIALQGDSLNKLGNLTVPNTREM